MSLFHWQQQMLKLAQGHAIDESSFLLKGSNLSARLQAYSNNYQGGLTSFLSITYPQVFAHLGAQYFDFICQAYIARNPMIKNVIDEYGRTFPNYLEKQIPIRKEMETFAFLPDMARVDWAVQSSYYSLPRPKFDFDSFAQLRIDQQQNVHFLLAQDIYLINSHWPLEKLWRCHKDAKELKAIEFKNEKNWVMVERPEVVVNINNISTFSAEYLSTIKQGATLAELVELDPDLLPQFISSGWIIGFTL